MLITDAYQSQMREMHVQREDFGKRGSQWAVIAMAIPPILFHTNPWISNRQCAAPPRRRQAARS